MSTYFNAADANDKNLLPPAVRTATDLANVAAEAEKDVIGQYTAATRPFAYTAQTFVASEFTPVLVNSSLGLYVFLRGYKKDASDGAVDVDLKDALKREIAGVIAWRFKQQEVNLLTTSEADGSGKSVQLRADANSVFPPGFGRRLAPFDIREPVWGS